MQFTVMAIALSYVLCDRRRDERRKDPEVRMTGHPLKGKIS